MSVAENRNYDDELRTAHHQYRYETVGEVRVTADLLKWIIEQIAFGRGVDVYDDAPPAEVVTPAPYPALIPTAAPSGEFTNTQPGYLQPEGARVQNSGNRAQNIMPNRPEVTADAESVYAPAYQGGAVPFFSSEQLGQLLGALQEIAARQNLAAPDELVQHAEAVPSETADETAPEVVTIPHDENAVVGDTADTDGSGTDTDTTSGAGTSRKRGGK